MRTYQALLGTLAVASLFVFPNIALAKPSVDLVVELQGDGSVTSVPAGINCPDQCAAQFAKATEVTLTATASNGNEFAGWSGACTGSNNSCVIKLVKDATTTATFALINLLPNAVDDNVTTDENVATTGNALTNDYQGNAPATVTAHDALSVQGGSVVMAANGSFSYTPMTDYFGPDNFNYTITDSNGDSDSAIVNVTVTEVPDPVAPPPAPVAQTGQVLCYAVDGAEIPCAGTGQDGETNTGVAWPVPRFTINGDGTVTDELTGLIWLRRMDCFYEHGSNAPIDWSESLSFAANLADGQCNLTDGSMAGDWRLPNTKEYLSLVDYQFSVPAMSNTLGTGQFENGDPFNCVSCVALNQLQKYWTSTTYTSRPEGACIFDAENGGVGCGANKSTTFGLAAGFWAVRDP